jgi:sugar phosphate isomerase/epimerase
MRKEIENDFSGTLRRVRELGFAGVEMCSPSGYKDAGFGNLAPLSADALRQQIEDTGLVCKSCHFQHLELRGDALQDSIRYGLELGLTDLVISGAHLPKDPTLDDWKAVMEEFNSSGAIVKDAGLQLVYHNHAIGPEYEGRPLYDHLMELGDPDLLKMQFQFASIMDGFDIVAYLDKYAGRFTALHLHDWSPEEEKIVAIGDGAIDWQKSLTAALKSPISDHGMIIEIESEPPDDPFEGLKRSIAYLRDLAL